MNSSPTLKSVSLSSDVIYGGLIHSFSTEHQEVMGLLIGSITNNEAIIKRILVLSRKDRQKDRVEVNYENLALASSIADELTKLDNDENRIIGWYHSHPHITVQPSHVDVATQGNYQLMDQGFIGLIFSVFDKSINGRIEICAFQSLNTVQGGSVQWSRVEIPVTIKPSLSNLYEPRRLEHLVTILAVLINEEKSTFQNYLKINNINMKSNPLAYSRASSVYQNSLLRLVDLQIKPVQNSIASQIKSLDIKKKCLLDQKKVKNCSNIPRFEEAYNRINRRVLSLSSVCNECSSIHKNIS